jgi:hypothetical protein
MVTVYDFILLVVGIFIGKAVFDPRNQIGVFSRLVIIFPCYAVIWFQVDRLFRFANISIADPAQIITFFLGVGIIWGATTRAIVQIPAIFEQQRVSRGVWAGSLIFLSLLTLSDATQIIPRLLHEAISPASANVAALPVPTTGINQIAGD